MPVGFRFSTEKTILTLQKVGESRWSRKMGNSVEGSWEILLVDRGNHEFYLCVIKKRLQLPSVYQSMSPLSTELLEM